MQLHRFARAAGPLGSLCAVLLGLVVLTASAPPIRANDGPWPLLLARDRADRGNPDAPLTLRALDPDTLADRADLPPLPLGARAVPALSPDRRTVAAFVWGTMPDPSSQHAGSARLHLIDLATWRDTPLAYTSDAWIHWFDYAPDGQALYWLATPEALGFDQAPVTFTLTRYDLRSHTAVDLLQLPGRADAPTVELYPGLGTGGVLAYYHAPIDAARHATDAPHLLLFDLAAGQPRYDLRLNDVPHGCTLQPDGIDRCLLPGLAWDWPRARLYVAHAEANRVTVVDLARGAVLAQRDIAGAASAPIETTAWAARPRTEMAFASRSAAVGADGTRLFIGGGDSEVEAEPDGGSRARRHIPGLRVIDTATLAEVARVSLVGYPNVTPDGARLLLHTARYENGQPVADPAAFRLVVLDTRSLRELGSLRVTPGDIYASRFSPDGRIVYLFRPGGGPIARDTAPDPPPFGGSMLARFDLTTQQIIAERSDELGWLISP